jgi:hypothetical protein
VGHPRHDIASAYFEGQCRDNPQAYSRDEQMAIGLGLPQAHDVTVWPPDLFADWG